MLAERPELVLRSRGCRILPAISRQEEMAEVQAEVGTLADAAPTILVRLRPRSLLDPALGTLQRRELLHVADMLDPAFGYHKELPGLDRDPAVLNLLRERCRVL